MRAHRNLLLLNFCVTFQDHDDYRIVEWSQLKKYLTRRELINIIRAVKSNPKAYSDTGVNYLIISSPNIHSVQWSY